MPYRITKIKGGYRVTRAGGKVIAKRTTKAKAEAQVRLIQAKEHGFKPTKRRT